MVFHMPEQHRITVAYARLYDIDINRINSEKVLGNNGFFYIPPPGGNTRHGRGLYIQASDAEISGWEHVSVHAEYIKQEEVTRGTSRSKRGSSGKGKFTRTKTRWISVVPNWDEMCRVKDLFWDPEDVVMQLHPRASQYVNNVGYVLHLWRCLIPGQEIPEPPAELVGIVGGPKTKEEMKAEVDRTTQEYVARARQAQHVLQTQGEEAIADYKRLHDAGEEVVEIGAAVDDHVEQGAGEDVQGG